MGIFVSSIIFVAAAVADSAVDFQGWENLGVKGLMGLAILYLTRELSRSRDATQAEQKEHLKTVTTTVAECTQAMTDLRSTLDKQNEFFDSISKQAVQSMLPTHSIHPRHDRHTP